MAADPLGSSFEGPSHEQLPSGSPITSAAAAQEVDEEELTSALNAIVHSSLMPLLVGLSVLYLLQMGTHMALPSRPNTLLTSLMAAGSSIFLLLLRMGLTRIAPESGRVYAIGGTAVATVLINTLALQSLTGEVKGGMMGLLLVGIGFVFLSTPWFVVALGTCVFSWLAATVTVHPVADLLVPIVPLLGTAALATMIHVVRRTTTRRAERLRRATERQQQALRQALRGKEWHRRSLVESQSLLQEALDDLKETKDALKDREERLSRMVRELTDAKEQAEEANQLKSAMLANMSHEVRTPLTSITGFAEIMAEETNGQAARFATLIYENSKRLLETLGSVLRLSKLEAGKETIKFERMDLTEELEALSTEQSERAARANVELRLETECDHCVCYLDRGAVQRILRNLVGNAIKFTDAGGTVVVRLAGVTRGAAVPGAACDFTHARLEVEDTGRGMSESFQKDMFKAFRQEQQTDRSGHKGSGLGLSITKQLVDLMEGEIEVESTKGEGTRFVIHLPRMPEGAKENGHSAEVRSRRSESV